MLRQIMNNAEAQQQEAEATQDLLLQQQQQQGTTESDALLSNTPSANPTGQTTTTTTTTNRKQQRSNNNNKTITMDYGATIPQPSNDFRSNYHHHHQQQQEEDDDDDDDDDEEEGDYLLEDDDDDDDDDDEIDHRPEPLIRKCWRLVKECFLVVVNVDNLYDEDGLVLSNSNTISSSDMTATTTTMTGATSASSVIVSPTRRNHLVVFFWFCILAMSYGLERSSFKLLVDRAGPFRLFSVLMVTSVHAMVLGFGMALSALQRRHLQQQQQRRNQERRDFTYFAPLGIPLVDVGLMALLDTLQILIVFVSGFHVPPTFSVILVQFTLPFAALLTQFVNPNGRCGRLFRRRPEDTETFATNSSGATTPSPQQQHQQQSSSSFNHNNGNSNGNFTPRITATGTIPPGTPLVGWGGLSAEHLWGSIIISVAVIMALCPALYSILNPDFFVYADPIPLQTAYNTLLYVSSCIPAAASQLYKESVFLHYKQPVDSNYLNLLLSLFQFTIVAITAPLVYELQGLGAKKHWQRLYPASTFSNNFGDGAKCFFGLLDENQAQHGYAEPARCGLSFGLVLLHVVAIISVGVAVDKILQAGATKVMYRGISVGIFVAVLSMYTYDLNIPYFNYGPAMDSLTLACLLLLIVGAEVYHRVSLQDAAFETIHQEVENVYATDS